MTILCVDDEALLLKALVRAVEASPDADQVVAFQKCTEALEWAENHRPGMAFLDIQMRGMTGMELAEKLRERYPDLPVVFCTGYHEYALEAFRMHISGYLVKPVQAEDIQREIDYVKGKKETKKLLTVQCFGNFDVFADGRPLSFKRKRAKEVLAYLVDRRGASVSAREICVALFEDDGDEQKNLMNLYKLFGNLRETLAAAGAEDVFIQGNREYAVDAEKIDCDFYRYLVGDPVAAKSFHGEYMLQYSWAEETAGYLQLQNM